MPGSQGDSIPAVVSAKATSAEPVVIVHDTYRKGVHTVNGTLMAPNACTFATAIATLVGSPSSQKIAVAVSLSPDVGVCLQLPQQIPFSTTLSAPSGLPIILTVNGIMASTSAP